MSEQSKRKFSDLIRQKHRDAFPQHLSELDTEALRAAIYKKAGIDPDVSSASIPFGSVKGLTKTLTLKRGERLKQAVLFWKIFETDHGLRVAASEDGGGLTFTWLAESGRNADTWIEPAGMEELRGSEYEDIFPVISKKQKVEPVPETEPETKTVEVVEPEEKKKEEELPQQNVGGPIPKKKQNPKRKMDKKPEPAEEEELETDPETGVDQQKKQPVRTGKRKPTQKPQPEPQVEDDGITFDPETGGF